MTGKRHLVTPRAYPRASVVLLAIDELDRDAGESREREMERLH